MFVGRCGGEVRVRRGRGEIARVQVRPGSDVATAVPDPAAELVATGRRFDHDALCTPGSLTGKITVVPDPVWRVRFTHTGLPVPSSPLPGMAAVCADWPVKDGSGTGSVIDHP